MEIFFGLRKVVESLFLDFRLRNHSKLDKLKLHPQ